MEEDEEQEAFNVSGEKKTNEEHEYDKGRKG